MKLKLAIILLLTALLMKTNHTLATSQFGIEQKKTVIENLAKAIKNEYVLDEEGLRFSQELSDRYRNDSFDDEETKEEFIQRINKRLFEITNDKHVSIRQKSSTRNNSQGRRMIRKTDEGPAGQAGSRKLVGAAEQSTRSLKKQFGLPEGESISSRILPGNIGLLTVNDLMGTETEMHQSMAAVSNTDGLIIDVRSCPGGSGTISNLISSYFIEEGEPLMRYYTRGKEVEISQSAKLPTGAKRFQNKPVYIVTSGFTGSACEALSYILKYHNRALTIGEKSAGAGHALTRELTSIGSGLVAFIPNTRPEHPKHKGGFEKVGVATDIEIGAAVAVTKTHQIILSQLLEKYGNNEVLSNALIDNNKKLTKKLLAQGKESRITSELLGTYGGKVELMFEYGQLKFKGSSGRKLPLKRVSNDLFSIMHVRGGQKVRINRNADGMVVSISMSPRSGKTEWKEMAKTHGA